MMLLMMIVLLTMRIMRRMRLMRKRMAKKKKKKKRNKRKKKHDANADDDGEEMKVKMKMMMMMMTTTTTMMMMMMVRGRVRKRCMRARSEAMPEDAFRSEALTDIMPFDRRTYAHVILCLLGFLGFIVPHNLQKTLGSCQPYLCPCGKSCGFPKSWGIPGSHLNDSSCLGNQWW